MTYKINDNKGMEYEIKDIGKFIEHIFKYHSTGISLHQENDRDFIVDDAFRKKLLKLLEKNDYSC